MSQISPPIRILLVSAVAFMAAWMLFLRPKDDAGAPAAATRAAAATQPVAAGGEKADSFAGKPVEKANDATAAQDAQAEAARRRRQRDADHAVDHAPSTPATAAAPPEQVKPGRADARRRPPRAGCRCACCTRSADHKVVVLLFWSPKSAEDKAVRKALTGIDRHHGKVLAHATHIKRIAAYGQITRGADVEQSPTVVVIDRNRKVETLVGYVDRRHDRPGRHGRAAQLLAGPTLGAWTPRPSPSTCSFPGGAATCPRSRSRARPAGAACGDLIRIDLRVEARPRRRRGLRGVRAAARRRGRLGGRRARRGAALLDAARIGAAEVAAELGGLSPGKLHAAELAADALHVALGAAVDAPRRGAAPMPARTLVAMSGGVDSAVAALLVARDGREAVAVTLELWRDAANDAEASCCSAHAVRLARSVAHRMGLPHFTLDLRAEFARRRRRAVPGRPRRRADAEPVRALQRQRAPRRDARVRRPARRGRPRDRPLRARHRRRAAARRRRPGEGPELHARRARARARSRACASRSASCASRRCARSRARPGCRSPTSASRRTCASSPAPARARSSPATAGCASGRARSSTAPAASSAATAASTCSRSASARASASPPPEPLYVLAKDRAAEHGHGRARDGARDDRGRRPRRRAAPPGRRGRPRQAALPHQAAAPAAFAAERRRPPRAGARRAGRRRGARPGRVPDARRRDRRPRRHRGQTRLTLLAHLDSLPMTSDEIRERFLAFFEQRDHTRLPSAPLVPRSTIRRRC